MANTLSNFAITTTDSDLYWRIIPGILRRLSVKDRHLTAPPGGDVEGDRYIVASVATGAWAGKEGTIAEYHVYTGVAIGWKFFTAPIGWPVYVVDETECYVQTSALTWAKLSTVVIGATPHYEDHTITGGDVAAGYIDLTVATFTTGGSLMQTFKRSSEPEILLTLGTDYTETSSTRVTYTAGVLEAGAHIISRWSK